jgi:hypothetical protein
MKAFALALAVVTSLPSFACRLDQPIDLSTLSFNEGFEFLGNYNTYPSFRMIFPESRTSGATTTQLYLNYPVDTAVMEGRVSEQVLGARVDLEDTDFGLGLWDEYEYINLERKIEKTAEGEVHTIKAYDLQYRDMPVAPYLSDMSVVKVQNNKIVSIEVGTGSPSGMKKACVTSSDL